LETKKKRKEEAEKNKISCRKFMNKFKDAIYGRRKEIVILNIFFMFQPRTLESARKIYEL
jgi:hypothetical protein